MKHIIGAYSILFVILIYIVLAVSLITVSSDVATASEYKAGVITEIENSNHNCKVIQSCVRDAARDGYKLKVTEGVYDDLQDIRTARVVLEYQYSLPLFGMERVRQTCGYAR